MEGWQGATNHKENKQVKKCPQIDILHRHIFERYDASKPMKMVIFKKRLSLTLKSQQQRWKIDFWHENSNELFFSDWRIELFQISQIFQQKL